MKAGWGIPNNWGGDNPNELIDIAVKAEDAGFASVWYGSICFTPPMWRIGCTTDLTTMH